MRKNPVLGEEGRKMQSENPENTGNSPKKGTVSTVSTIMGITLLGKCMGLWRDRLLALAYGTGMEANAFYTASRIPRVFFDAIFASAIAVCLIPVFSRLETTEGKDKANLFGGNFISVMGVLTAVLTLLGMCFATPMVSLFAGGYDMETQALAVTLTQMMFPTVFFTGIAFSFVGILQSRESFFVPALISCLSNGVIIGYFYFFDGSYGIYGLAIAYLIGWLGQAVVQIPSLKNVGFSYRPNFSTKTPEMKQVFLLMAPVMVSTWVQPINLTINTRYGSYLHEGAGVTMIEIATNLYLILAGVFILSITNVIFPRLSKLTVEGAGASFQETLRETLHITLFFTLPMSVGLGVVAEPLVSLLYGGGEFDAEAVAHTAQALQWISLGMAGYGVQTLVSRAYFAKEQGKTPLIAGGISILLNGLLCHLWVGQGGISALALASSVSATVYGLILLFALDGQEKKQGNPLVTGLFLRDVAKMIGASVILKVGAEGVLAMVAPYGILLSLGVTAVTGLMLYLLVALVLGLSEMDIVRNKLKKS